MVYNWGILGPGSIATHALLPAFQHSHNSHVIALASRDLARAQSVAAQWDIEHAYGDYQALLDDPTIDAVYIALPNNLHAHWTIQAAQAGKHVLCEKPLACSTQEVEAMLTACQQAGVQLMEASMYRFHPRIQHLKYMLDQGEIGQIRFLHSAFSFTLKDTQNYRYSPAFGGGALLDVGYYCINSICWLSDALPVDIYAFATYQQPGGIDLDTSAFLRFPGDITGHIQCSFATAEYQTIEIVGTEGAIIVPLAFTAWQNDTTSLRIQRGTSITEQTFAPSDPYKLMVEHFVEATQSQTPLLYPPQTALQTSQVIDAIRTQAQKTSTY